jgi:[acyl-carrier-protein] S-malonyltransferase
VSIRTAFIFPGQGSQHAGMLEAVPELETLDRLLDAAEALSGLELSSLACSGSAEELSDTRVAQPLLYLTDWAWGYTLLESGIEPVALAGHSLGELAALAVAGVFSPEAGLELVVERSKLMAATAASSPGTMSAVLGLDSAAISAAIEGIPNVWLANDNSAGQVVISGAVAGVSEASEKLLAAGARKVVPLPVAGAFHSPLMEPAKVAFEQILAGAEFSDAKIPVVQNTDPTPETDGQRIRERLIGQITAPVRWTETIAALAGLGLTRVIEAGPGSVLSGLAKRTPGVTAFAVETTDLESLVQEVSEQDV